MLQQTAIAVCTAITNEGRRGLKRLVEFIPDVQEALRQIQEQSSDHRFDELERIIRKLNRFICVKRIVNEPYHRFNYLVLLEEASHWIAIFKGLHIDY